MLPPGGGGGGNWPLMMPLRPLDFSRHCPLSITFSADSDCICFSGPLLATLSLFLLLKKKFIFAFDIIFLAVCGQIPPSPSWCSYLPNVIIHVSDILGHRFSCLNFHNYKELQGQLKSQQVHEFYRETANLCSQHLRWSGCSSSPIKAASLDSWDLESLSFKSKEQLNKDLSTKVSHRLRTEKTYFFPLQIKISIFSYWNMDNVTV